MAYTNLERVKNSADDLRGIYSCVRQKFLKCTYFLHGQLLSYNGNVLVGKLFYNEKIPLHKITYEIYLTLILLIRLMHYH